MKTLLSFLLCAAGAGAATIETTPLGEAVSTAAAAGCVRVAATAAITVTVSNQQKKQQHMLPSNQAPGAQEVWEEEYDDWDGTDDDDDSGVMITSAVNTCFNVKPSICIP